MSKNLKAIVEFTVEICSYLHDNSIVFSLSSLTVAKGVFVSSGNAFFCEKWSFWLLLWVLFCLVLCKEVKASTYSGKYEKLSAESDIYNILLD